MTAGEATNLNTLLRFVLGLDDHSGQPVTSLSALNAARLLAERSHKAIAAGLMPDDVIRGVRRFNQIDQLPREPRQLPVPA